jgi:hypothetical protein
MCVAGVARMPSAGCPAVVDCARAVEWFDLGLHDLAA